MDGFTETTGSLARLAGVLPETVRAYGDLGLIECQRTANGVRMFRANAAEQVKKIVKERLARRGGRRPAAV
jgi:DNA-binding transcriptional MerR regulator